MRTNKAAQAQLLLNYTPFYGSIQKALQSNTDQDKKCSTRLGKEAGGLQKDLNTPSPINKTVGTIANKESQQEPN